MNAMLQERAPAMPAIRRMGSDDIDELMAIEVAEYPFPWTAGNFRDSIHSGYEAWILRGAGGDLQAYFLLMPVLDEGHLLNITVRGDLHGQGLGRALLDSVCELARKKQLQSILLEVRPSNQRALAVYQRYGFVRIGLRKNYYPAPEQLREDAIVMRFTL